MLTTSQLPAWCLPVTQWMLLQAIVGLSAAFTPSHSRLRHVTLAIALALASSLQSHVVGVFSSSKVAGLVAALCWAHVFNAVDILVLSRVTYDKQLEWERWTSEDGVGKYSELTGGFSWRRLAWALELPFNIRRIDTPWQISNIPAFDNDNHQYTPSRLKFLGRRGLILCLALVSVLILHRRKNDDELHDMISAERQNILHHGPEISIHVILFQISLTASYWLNMRTGHQIAYNIFSIISVASGIHKPAAWPPLAGSLMEAWSLRQLWGCTWHQGFRKLLTSNADFITSSIFQIRPGTLWSRYTRLFMTFLISGIIHLLMDLARGIPIADSGSMLFFTLQALGIMAEDLIIHIGTRVVGGGKKWWKRMIGCLWVAVFLFLTTPLYSYPICRGLFKAGERIPFLYL